jgi:dienelactone hydrolase
MTPTRRSRLLRIALMLWVAQFGAAALGAQMKPPPIQNAQPGSSGRRVDQHGFVGNYFPAGKSSPALLILGGSEGGLSEGIAGQSRVFQAEGFSVLQLSYFRLPGQNPRLEHIRMEYFGDALSWLKQQPEVDANRVGVYGISKGAEAAMLIAARHRDVKAVVAGMPSSVVWPGIAWDSMDAAIGSSWSENGKPLPFLPYGQPIQMKSIADVYQAGLNQLAAHPTAIIPVERITARVLLVCGEVDTLWPGCVMARLLESRAREHKGPQVELLAYADAGHGGIGQPLPPGDPRMPALAGSGGTPEGNNKARADSWPRIMGFLKAALAR